MRGRVAGLVLLSAVAAGRVTAETRSLLAVAPRSPWTLRELERARAELVSWDPDTGIAWVTATEAETRRLQDLGFGLATAEPDLDQGLRAIGASRELGLYHSYAETVLLLQSLAARFPDLCRLESLGASLEGRDVPALKISDEPEIDDPDEADVLVVGCHHAREFMSVEVPLDLARTLLEGYAGSARLRHLVDDRELWVVPMLNVDGHVYQEELAASPDWHPPGWRKNRRPNFDGTTGVDLNRNYSYMWGYDEVGSSPEGADDTYRGTGPFSEPETRLIRQLAHRQRFRIALSYHSFGRLLLYPWGHVRALTPDHELFSTLADSMVRYNGYRAGNPFLGTIYITNGDFDDWAYGELSLDKPEPFFGFTPELNGQGQGGFWPPDSLIEPTCEAMRYTNLFALAVAESLSAPLAPPAPEVAGVQDASDRRRIHLEWTQPDDPMNPVVRYEVFEIDPDGAAFDAPPARLEANGRVVLVRDVPRPASGELVLRVDALLEPLWDYVYFEARPVGGAWRTLAGDATRDASPTGRNAGRGVTGPQLGRRLRFRLDAELGSRVDLAVRLDADPRSPRRPTVSARLDAPNTWTETRRVLDPDVRDRSYEILTTNSGLLGYGVTAVDAQGQRRDSELLFFIVPAVDVQVSDVSLEADGRRLRLRWRQSSSAPAHYEAWTRPHRDGDAVGDAAAEWARGGWTRAATAQIHGAGDTGLEWESPVGGWRVLLRGEDADGPRFWGPWTVEVVAATALRPAVPNPFNPSTELVFEVARPGPVRLDLLSVDGRLVRSLVSGHRPAGAHRVRWDGRDAAGRSVASGLYVARLQAGAEVRTRRLVVVR